MKAIRYYAKEDIRVEDVPAPDLRIDSWSLSRSPVGFAERIFMNMRLDRL